ncbi:TetR/AcrR family transcriptional regulator [Levilactobacillus parabrevis]|nr:TetR/AcrR family transcriptional regulator [Levilactobacillus parabrevis]
MANVLTPTQKTARARRIATAAWQLFQTHAFSEISMAMIARQAGVAKGTLFNYYQTKESIFMTLLLEGYRDYFRQLITRLAAEPQMTSAQVKAYLLAETKTLITQHATLVRLNALRGPVLEAHADRTQTVAGRRDLYTVNVQLGEVLATKLPGLDAQMAAHLFVIQSAIISGLMNLSGLDHFKQTTLSADFPAFQINLEVEAQQTFGFYLDGIFKEEFTRES